ncbi:MAG: MBOAT family O-acyltransferase [Oscillospiraceae bacterium]
MVFSSLIFLYAFFPLSLLGCCLCRSKAAQNVVLLVFSLVFYAWGEPVYVLLLMFMALTAWFCALRVKRAETRGRKRAWTAVSCAIDIALIGFFKYSGLVCSLFGPVPDFVAKIALPIGISFYTFQLLTYVVDVYRGEAQPQKSYWNVLLYAALFHQCIAGPIVRYKGIEGELFGPEPRQPEWTAGISRFAAGLGKKVLLANPCGALADSILLPDSSIADPALLAENMASIASQPVLGVWLGVIAYALQIYLDFSAYSDMAIGMGRMLGLHYPENFSYPYLSRSVTEFWRRWHMTLGAFFRDYVYIPLGGSRRGRLRWVFNTLLVWALTGLWHGAGWNFVLWGLWSFAFMMLEKAFLKKRVLDRAPVLSNLYLLLVTAIGWILFRFSDLELGWTVFKGLWGLNGNVLTGFYPETLLRNKVFLLLVCVLVCTPLAKRLGEKLDAAGESRPALGRAWRTVKFALLPIALLLLSTAALVGDSYNPFLYFQF